MLYYERVKDMKILFTGGGSAGHVTLNIQLINEFLPEGHECLYVGSKRGIERSMIEDIPNVKYIPITTGKLRRYFSIQNIFDLLKVPFGILQAIYYIGREKPDFIFSKGGYVSVPVVLGAYINSIPIILHESDRSIGLANKISGHFASKIFSTFEIGKNNRFIKVGGIAKCIEEVSTPFPAKFNSNKPIILFLGGSLGAKSINDFVTSNLDDLLQNFNIIHQTGDGYNPLQAKEYFTFPFSEKLLPQALNLADYVVSRSGSNTIFEILSNQKPNILIPLSKESSRGDQVENAEYFEEKGYSMVIKEGDLNYQVFKEKIEYLSENEKKIQELMSNSNETMSVKEFSNLLLVSAKEEVYGIRKR